MRVAARNHSREPALLSCSTAFVAGRRRSIRHPRITKAQLAFVDADLASDLLEPVVATIPNHHLAIADSAAANDVVANYKSPGGFIFLAYILFSFWAGGVELVKRVQTWQENRQDE
jgi:hypothetical protein